MLSISAKLTPPQARALARPGKTARIIATAIMFARDGLSSRILVLTELEKARVRRALRQQAPDVAYQIQVLTAAEIEDDALRHG